MKGFSFMKILLLFLYSCLISLLLTACSNINEGEIDYVRTVSNKILATQDCSQEDYSSSLNSPAGVTRKCYETLYRKYQEVPSIRQGDTISVHMMQGYVLGSNEGRTPYELFTGRSANAEVVVIASVCEQGIAGCGLEFGPSSDKAGRVIYFSDGVKAKQYLNFSYLPVYGPIEYKGGPLVVKLSILELDDMSDKQVSLLKALAEQGKKAYPPASTALTLLDTLGASLLQGSGDDINFRYTMTLAPGTGDSNYNYPTLSAGNYAFLKKDTYKGPQEQEIWKNLMFDQVSGRLVMKCNAKDYDKGIYTTKNVDQKGKSHSETIDYTYCTSDSSGGHGMKDFRERTYLTFQIQTGFAERTLDQPQTLQALISDINAQKDIDAQFVTEATDSLGEYLSRTSIENKLNRPLAAIKSSFTGGLLFELDRVKLEAYKFIEEYIKAVNDRNTKCNGAVVNNCDEALSEDDIWSVTHNTRQILISMDPSADVDAVNSLQLPAPQSYADAIVPTVKNNVITLFQDAYLYDYQKKLTENYWQMRNNLMVSYQQLEFLDSDSKPTTEKLEQTKTLAKRLLVKLKTDIELFIEADCDNSPTKNACYRLPNEAGFKSILTMSRSVFNKIGKVSDDGTKLLDDNLLKSGFDIADLQSLLDDVKLK